MRFPRLSWILWTALAMAQTSPGPVVIKTETRMVLVDAVVTTKSGAAVPDLTARDFQVFEDGKPQTIQSVSYVAEPANANQPSYLLLFFDNVSLDLASQNRARAAAIQFIEANSGPNRYMAIVNYNGGLSVSQNFTTDTERLERVADREVVTGTAAQGRNPAAGGSGPEGLARSIRLLAANLSSVSGRKSLVLFSGGYSQTGPLNVLLLSAVEACNRSDVAIYPVDVSGLTQPGMNGGVDSSRAGGRGRRGGSLSTPAGSDPGSMSEILFALAAPTGGYVAANPNDVLAGLMRIAREQTDYYLLGYTPPESPDGSCHPLKVKVDRPRTNVRARVSYCNVKAVDLLAGKPVERELEYRVTGSDAGNIKASMQLPYFYTEADTARLNVAMEIASSSIRFEKVKGKSHGELNIVGIAYLPDGTAAARFSDTVKFDFAAAKEVEEFRARPLHYEKEFFVAPGNYTFKVAFTSGGESFGKLEAPLAIPPYDGRQFMLSGLALSKEVRPASELGSAEDAELIEGRTPLIYKEAKIIPAGSARFSSSDPLSLYGEIYDPVLASGNPPVVEIRMRVSDRAGSVKFGGAMRPEIDKNAHSSTLPFALKIKVDSLAPGGYRADVEAVDSAGNSMLRSVDFEIR